MDSSQEVQVSLSSFFCCESIDSYLFFFFFFFWGGGGGGEGKMGRGQGGKNWAGIGGLKFRGRGPDPTCSPLRFVEHILPVIELHNSN